MIYKTIPDIHSKWFIRNGRGGRYINYGGYSPCCTGYKEIFEGCSLNNCVGGAWGMFAQAENNPDCKVGFISCDWCPDGAEDWWNDGKQSKWDKYERGKKPKEGSIICYSSGHVAYVNEVKENGDIDALSSGWGNTDNNGIEHRYLKAPNYEWPVGNSVKGFQGFIYPLEKKEDYKTLYLETKAKLDKLIKAFEEINK